MLQENNCLRTASYSSKGWNWAWTQHGLHLVVRADGLLKDQREPEPNPWGLQENCCTWWIWSWDVEVSSTVDLSAIPCHTLWPLATLAIGGHSHLIWVTGVMATLLCFVISNTTQSLVVSNTFNWKYLCSWWLLLQHWWQWHRFIFLLGPVQISFRAFFGMIWGSNTGVNSDPSHINTGGLSINHYTPWWINRGHHCGRFGHHGPAHQGHGTLDMTSTHNRPWPLLTFVDLDVAYP